MAFQRKKGTYRSAASGNFPKPPDWNPEDNEFHCVGAGATGDANPPSVQGGQQGGNYAGAVNVKVADGDWPLVMAVEARETAVKRSGESSIKSANGQTTYCSTYPTMIPAGNPGGAGSNVASPGVAGCGGGAGGPDGPGGVGTTASYGGGLGNAGVNRNLAVPPTWLTPQQGGRHNGFGYMAGGGAGGTDAGVKSQLGGQGLASIVYTPVFNPVPGQRVVLVLTEEVDGNSFREPPGWNPDDNTVEIISSGGWGQNAYYDWDFFQPYGAPGGGGGAYAVAVNVNPTFPVSLAWGVYWAPVPETWFGTYCGAEIGWWPLDQYNPGRGGTNVYPNGYEGGYGEYPNGSTEGGAGGGSGGPNGPGGYGPLADYGQLSPPGFWQPMPDDPPPYWVDSMTGWGAAPGPGGTGGTTWGESQDGGSGSYWFVRDGWEQWAETYGGGGGGGAVDWYGSNTGMQGWYGPNVIIVSYTAVNPSLVHPSKKDLVAIMA